MLKRKLFRTILLVVLAVLPAAGCWDSVDINDRNILTAVVVDKTDYGFAFYVEVPHVSGETQDGNTSQQKKPDIVKSEGRDYLDARRNLDAAMDKPIFLGAVQTVILTDRLASYDIEEYMLRLRQLFDYRKTVNVVVTPEDPEALLNAISEHSQSAGFAVYDTIESLVASGQLYKKSLMDILESLAAPYNHYSMATIALVNGELTFTGLTIFSGGMKTGFIPAAEINSLVFIKAKKPKLHYSVPYNDTRASVEVRLASKKIKPNYTQGKVSFDMALKFKATFIFPEKAKPVTDMDMNIIQNTLQAMLEQEFTEMFKKSQEVYHYDCYRLHDQFRIAYPEEYKKMDWAGEYQKTSLYLAVSVDLASTEMIDYNPEEK